MSQNTNSSVQVGRGDVFDGGAGKDCLLPCGDVLNPGVGGDTLTESPLVG